MTKALLLSMALSAISLSVIASSAAKSNKTEEIAAVSTCGQQIWPTFSQNCLLTIQGQKSNRKFRVVTY